MWFYLLILILFIGIGIFIYYKFFYNSNEQEVNLSHIDNYEEENKIINLNDDHESSISEEETNNEITINNLFDGTSDKKKINIYASYECGSIAGSLTQELLFSKNNDDKEKWLIEIIDMKDNIVSGTVQSLSLNKYWAVIDSQLELVEDNKIVFEFIFGQSDKSKNVCIIKVKESDKFIELSKEGKLLVVDKLNEDNFKFKIIQVDE